MKMLRKFGLCASLIVLISGSTSAEAERLEWHAAPAENLEHIDVTTLATARETIDMAAFLLTDWAIMDALRAAAKRGVGVRIVLDGSQFKPGNHAAPFLALLAEPNVMVRVKPTRPDLMHLKAYRIDGKLLRTGSANFSASGLKRQDNDLLITDDRRIVDAFDRTFEAIWDAAEGAETPRTDVAEPKDRRPARLD